MWLLAQHADADPAFQRHCLGLLAAAVEAGEATLTDQAFLTDRVLLARGQAAGVRHPADKAGRQVGTR